MSNKSFKRIALILFNIVVLSFVGTANSNTYTSDTTINPPLVTTSYNDTIYNSVLEASMGIAQPYLLHQNYYTMAGVTVSGNAIVYNGVTYPVTESYFNPGTGYYIASALYAQYGISKFSSVWPTQCPNAFYDSATHSFSSKIDCVGFGTRLLSAVGGTTSTTNAYLNLLNRIRTNNVAPFASKGFVATAYQFGIAFPTLKTAPKPGWEYVSGNICATSVIDGYNHVLRSTIGTYNGVRKGGFGLCKAGDVLAFSYDSLASSNGHWMVIEGSPILLDAAGLQVYYPKASATKVKAFVVAHKVYAVPVIDDSGKSVHFNDSRTSYSGIGHGTVLIVADTADDAPVGFIFSPSTNISYSPIDTSHCYAISVGRFTSAVQLPIQLVSLDAVAHNKEAVINWQTNSEQNTRTFIVQHSLDGVRFNKLRTIKAKGGEANSYSIIDANPDKGNNYYRLQIIDDEGKIDYSKIVNLNMYKLVDDISIYPNPARDIVMIKAMDLTFVKIIDNVGRIVLSKELKDVTNPSISIGGIRKGVYHLKVQTLTGESYNASFIKE